MVNWSTMLPLATSFLAALAAVLAWAAKLWWGKEFASAKDATIKSLQDGREDLKQSMAAQLGAKDAEIQVWKEKHTFLERKIDEDLWKQIDSQIERQKAHNAELREDADRYKELNEELGEKLQAQIEKSAGDAKQISFLQEVALKIQEQGSLATERWMEKSEQVRKQEKELETLRETLLATARFQVHGARVVIGKPPPLDTPSDQHDLIEKLEEDASADPDL
jgi:predicted RNase H-like nuclease (RuvC/YqgF family)